MICFPNLSSVLSSTGDSSRPFSRSDPFSVGVKYSDVSIWMVEILMLNLIIL